MPRQVSLYQIFKDFLDHNSFVFRTAINFREGKDFEENLKTIFNNNGIRFEYQPNGSQEFPDFFLPDYDVEINIECKTSKNGKIVWNSGFPHNNMILLYASRVDCANDITFFLGEDRVESNTTRDEIKQWENDKKIILKQNLIVNLIYKAEIFI